MAIFYLAIMLKPLMPVVHYTYNYGVYSTELCENKDKPEMLCNGTCQLSKMYADMQAEQETPPTLPPFEGLEWYMGLVEKEANMDLLTGFATSHSFFYNTKHSVPHLPLVTPPPQVLV